MRIVIIVLAFILFMTAPATASEATIDTGLGQTSDSFTIGAHQDGSTPAGSTAPAPTEYHYTGNANAQPVQHVDCNTLDPTVPASPQAVKDCSVATPTVGNGAPPATTPQAILQQESTYAIDYLQSLTLPVPRPQMSSPNGVCGVAHSLDLQIPDRFVYSDSTTPFGKLVMDVQGSFVINWGDGTSNTYNTSGAPYPKSALSHVWETKGIYTITTTANWSATWSFADHQGTLTGAHTQSTLTNWQVYDIQAQVKG